MNKKNVNTIMQVLPTLVSGGVETGTIDIAKAIVEKGHHAVVVSAGGPMVRQLLKIGAEHINLPVHSKNPWVMWRNAQALKRIIQTKKIDLVHARSRAPAWSCYWASKNTKTPYITTFHGAYSHQNKLKRWYNAVMLRSIKTIAVSHFIAQHIKQTYPNCQYEMQVIHRGIDTHKYDVSQASTDKVNSLRESWSVPDGYKVIMLPGRLTRLKGHHIFIEAVAKIK